MKKLIKAVFWLVTICFLNSSNLFADYEDIGCGVRPLGMGNTFVGLSDDANSMYYNPAGLEQLTRAEFISSYGRLYLGLDDESNIGNGFIGYVQPLKKFGTVGVGRLNFSLVGLYEENITYFSYSKKLYGQLLGGLNLKLLSKGYGEYKYNENAIDEGTGDPVLGQVDPVFSNGYSKSGFAVDLGFLYNFGNGCSFGLAGTNLNRPNMDLKDTTSSVSPELKSGFAYKSESVNFALDMAWKNQDTNIYTGAEKWFLKRTFAIRYGLGYGSREYRSISLGASYNVSLFQFDYAFIYPLSGIKNTQGSHKFSLTLRFGPFRERIEERGLKEKFEKKVKEAEKEAENARIDAVKAQNEANVLQANYKKLQSETETEISDLKVEIEILKQKITTEGKGLPETKTEKVKRYFSEAEKLYNKGDYAKATSLWQKILELEPNHRASLTRLNSARAKLKELGTLNKKKEYWSKGYKYYQQGEYNRAIPEFEKILEIDPNHEQSKKLIGQCKVKSKEDAEKYYTQGLVEYSNGRLEEAVKLWEKALSLQPENNKTRTALEGARKELQMR